ncbi:MAG: NAD-dependent epimerase/dehydratase family protein [Nitrosopumilus sp.]|nr:NAD-dependent epimerase/dehydratase family protein [Nitrosopumilus sp.]MDH3385525.1 NAD-dependent epimerase/dehydratase family protein [Nitrosopumilus sp.]
METKIIGRLYTISLRILITGGAGFIGRYLVNSLSSHHEVTIYDNLSNSSKKNIEFLLKKGVKFVHADILDYEKLQKSCIGYDLIIHLAAKSDVADSVIHPEITNKVNIVGTENVIRCCIENKIKKIIFASSSAVYEDSKVPINENAKTNPVSPYGKSKLVAEKKIKEFSKEHGIDAISLRMFNVFGIGQNEKYYGAISKFVENILKNKPIEINGDGEQTRDFIGILDVVEAFNCAIKNIQGKKGDVFNIGTGKSISINELVKMILRIADKKIEVKNKKQNKSEIKFSVADVTLAKIELGFIAKQKLEDQLIKLL